MAAVQGYQLLTLTSTTLTPQQESDIRDALRTLGTASSPYPDRILVIRVNLAHTQMIVKSYWPNGYPTKAQVVTQIANVLGVANATVNSRLTITLFTAQGGDIYGGEADAGAYIQVNLAAWETALP